MQKVLIESAISKFIIFGAPLVTVFILTGTVTDPVNVTKFFVLCGLAGGLISIIFAYGIQFLYMNFKAELGCTILFFLAVLSSTLFSGATISQSIYGVYGRNTGALTYSALAVLFLGTLFFSTEKHFRFLAFGIFAAALVNIFYCSWTLLFGDFIGWDNTYGNTLGLFGNPNFISSFLGIAIGAVLAYFVPRKGSLKNKILAISLSGLAFYFILKSHAIQGLMVTLSGLALIGFLKLRDLSKGRFINSAYVLFVMISGAAALAGILQKGPFTFLYKRSVSLRGTYWHTGIEMANSNPIFGVGLDSYGDWYRRFRPEVALIDTPGKNTTTNAAHNVFIDLFASGGYPLLISYVAILLLALRSATKILSRNRSYDPIFATLLVVWMGYNIQSIVSINQIGLAIWGWLFSGSLISYEFATRPNRNKNQIETSTATTKKAMSVVSPQLVGGIGVLVGLFVAYPPISADANWYKTMASNDVQVYEKMLQPSFMNPSNSYKYAQAVDLFSRSNFPEYAMKYALLGVEFNPNYFTAWQQMYALPNASQEQKRWAVENMKRLDPKNPDVTAP